MIVSDIANRYAINITPSNDTVYDPPLSGLLITHQDGDVVFDNAAGGTVTITIPSNITAPVYVNARIRRVISSAATGGSITGFRN